MFISATFTWNSDNTRFLITEYGKRIEQFRNPKMKKKLIWTEIKDAFNKNGYILTEDELDRKMRNLKHHYKTIKDNNNKKTKTGRGRIVWEFYALFEEIFAEDRTINHGETLASLSEAGPPLKQQLSEELSTSATFTPKPSTSHPFTPKHEEAKIKKAIEARGLYRYRNECLKLETRRVVALEKLAEQAEENNKIQRERNEILRQNKCSCSK